MDWLRTKLESLESALLAGTLDSGLLAALDGATGGGGGSDGAADVLEAAHAAVFSGSWQLQGGGVLGALREEAGTPGAGSDGGSTLGSLLSSMEPLASQLAAAAHSWLPQHSCCGGSPGRSRRK